MFSYWLNALFDFTYKLYAYRVFAERISLLDERSKEKSFSEYREHFKLQILICRICSKITGYIGNSPNIRKKNPTPTLSKSGWDCGAGGRARTGTVLPPVDFESTSSTNSNTPAWCLLSIVYFTGKCKKKFCQVGA